MDIWKKLAKNYLPLNFKYRLNPVVIRYLKNRFRGRIGERQFWKKTPKKFLGFIFRHLLNPVFIRVFKDTNLAVIGGTR